jgi:hypothetical protein
MLKKFVLNSHKGSLTNILSADEAQMNLESGIVWYNKQNAPFWQQYFNFYDLFYMFRTRSSIICLHADISACKQIIPYLYNRLPEDEPLDSKHVENIVEINILV